MKFKVLALAVSVALSLPVFASQPEPVPAARAGGNWTRTTEKPQPAPVAVPVAASDALASPPAAPAEEPERFGLADSEAGEAALDAASDESEAAPAPLAVADDTEPSADAWAAALDADAEEAASAEQSAGFDSTPAAPAPRARGVELGPLAWDEAGVKGRIHTVRRGDTLWDVSEAYLGTPWVWPSIWNDNGGIANPHLISPGDRIWISSTEMRRLSEDEALSMLSSTPPAANEEGDLELAEEPAPVSDLEGAPATMDSLPVHMSQRSSGSGETGQTLRLSGRGGLGFVASEVVEGATSIIGSVPMRTMLSLGDRVYVGFGRSQTKVGDRYTIFRDPKTVRDANGTVLGYHVEIVGGVEVRSTDLESSEAEITEAMSEITVGDLVMAHRAVPSSVAVKYSPAGLHGRIVFLPRGRTLMGNDDFVYLNRGRVHGLEMGSELEVFEHGKMARDHTRGRNDKLRTPDRSVANLVVVEVQDDTSVAYVTSAVREIEVGDLVRTPSRELAAN